MLLLLIVLILIFGGGGFYGYRSGYLWIQGNGLRGHSAYRPGTLSRDGRWLRRFRTRNVCSMIA
jgi:hypothetical protein